MASTQRRYSKEDFARRGDAIYDDKIRPSLTEADEGKFVAIDIETSDFEIGTDEWEAGENLRSRITDAQIWMVRIGSPYVHRFGGRVERPNR